jgi:hypothetical protein
VLPQQLLLLSPQILRWQTGSGSSSGIDQQPFAKRSSMATAPPKPRLTLSLEDADPQAAAMAVLAALYSVNTALYSVSRL